MYHLDDYAKAYSKLREAEQTSNLESELETASQQQETRKRLADLLSLLLNRCENVVFFISGSLMWSPAQQPFLL